MGEGFIYVYSGSYPLRIRWVSGELRGGRVLRGCLPGKLRGPPPLENRGDAGADPQLFEKLDRCCTSSEVET